MGIMAGMTTITESFKSCHPGRSAAESRDPGAKPSHGNPWVPDSPAGFRDDSLSLGLPIK